MPPSSDASSPSANAKRAAVVVMTAGALCTLTSLWVLGTSLFTYAGLEYGAFVMLVAWPFFLGMFVAIVAPMATGVILLLSSKGVGSGDAEVSERARLWSGAGAFTAGLLTVVFFVADSSLTFTGVPVWVWLLVLGVVLGWAAWSVYVAMKSTDA